MESGRQIFIVLNPVAGLVDPVRTSRRILAWCEQNGWNGEIYLTSEGEDLSRPVKKAIARGVQVVVAAGGDGTVSGVASGLVGTSVPLAILPLGSGNLLAHDLGVPIDLYRALNVIERENITLLLDAMQVNGRCAVLNAGVGFSSLLIQNTPREEKRRFGLLAYFGTAVRVLFGLQPHQFRLTVDGKKIRLRASEIYVANGGLVGVQLPFEDLHIYPDDGRVDMFVIKARTLRDYLEILYYIIRRRPRQAPKMFYLQGADIIQIDSESGLPVQADGEVVGETPVTIRVLPNAVKVLLPERQNEPLVNRLAQIVGIGGVLRL